MASQPAATDMVPMMDGEHAQDPQPHAVAEILCLWLQLALGKAAADITTDRIKLCREQAARGQKSVLARERSPNELFDHD